MAQCGGFGLYCTQCGTLAVAGGNYCANCGYPQGAAARHRSLPPRPTPLRLTCRPPKAWRKPVIADLDLMQTLAFAGLALLAGQGLRRLVPLLERYNLPTPVLGGGLLVAVAI